MVTVLSLLCSYPSDSVFLRQGILAVLQWGLESNEDQLRLSY